ncbi:hypothetical protein NE237_018834 [Protea cynaroides]|uniref:Uncharacterized protein n=1 Tax=Protea cynaroides TaxID=273540 RepID=A0A9Q0QPA7_9MAGN|nr:hypothetical protein NE237_018834 [Protea cynaroides]
MFLNRNKSGSVHNTQTRQQALAKAQIEGEESQKSNLRDFKLLVAQVKFIVGSSMDALKIYQDLEKEKPKDFRPYRHQGIIYTLLRKKDEAEKQLQKYRRLIPREHSYARSFDGRMLVTKVFLQMEERKWIGRSRQRADIVLRSTRYKYHFPFPETHDSVTVDNNCVRSHCKHDFPPLLVSWLSFIGLQ